MFFYFVQLGSSPWAWAWAGCFLGGGFGRSTRPFRLLPPFSTRTPAVGGACVPPPRTRRATPHFFSRYFFFPLLELSNGKKNTATESTGNATSKFGVSIVPFIVPDGSLLVRHQ
jgi:hypothetical protein